MQPCRRLWRVCCAHRAASHPHHPDVVVQSVASDLESEVAGLALAPVESGRRASRLGGGWGGVCAAKRAVRLWTRALCCGGGSDIDVEGPHELLAIVAASDRGRRH